MESIKTPRGTFRVKFTSMQEANDNGYYLYFEHEGYAIVANGTLAFAVKAIETAAASR